MSNYGIEIFDNHVIILMEGKRVLLDTGAPTTISDGSSLQMMGINYNLPSKYLGFSMQEFNQLIGTEINILLGADILKNVNFLVEWDKKEIQFSSTPFMCKGVSIPVDFYMGIPKIDLKVNGRGLKVFLDTGAKLSYLPSEITSRYKRVGTAQDFYPLIGRFTTDIYEIEVGLGNHLFPITAGNLPELLQMTLAMTNAKGILGNDIFKNFNVCFNYTGNEIVLVEK